MKEYYWKTIPQKAEQIGRSVKRTRQYFEEGRFSETFNPAEGVFLIATRCPAPKKYCPWEMQKEKNSIPD